MPCQAFCHFQDILLNIKRCPHLRIIASDAEIVNPASDFLVNGFTIQNPNAQWIPDAREGKLPEMLHVVSILSCPTSFFDSLRRGTNTGGIGEMPSTPPEDRHRPLFPILCQLRTCPHISLHPASHQFRQRPVALTRDAFQKPEQRFGKLNLRPCHGDRITLPSM
jgi:hypothetical protein